MALQGDKRVARRYALALFEAVSKANESIDAAAADLSVISEMLANVPYLKAVLQQPLVSEERKMEMATEAFQSRLGAKTLGFIHLMIRKRRDDVIEDAIAEFHRLADEHAGRLTAYVESPSVLSPEQIQKLEAALSLRTGKTIHVHASINAHMMGGLRVRLGDSVMDGALRSRLEQLHQRLLAAR